ncbi:TetR/AcrR family transcriptional regulator [Kitasatospora sp. NPDC056651]|uniref:TetR/AcrR family transcriptional regulator n=1 Tax=Kitasatospora sp. NPDC056651 TaxID=3345892 RepID=UPI00367BFB62
MAQQRTTGEPGRPGPGPGPGPRRPRPGLTTGAVVAAARRLIERDGIDALTMRAVAAELDTAAASLYRHVSDRESLLLAVLDEIADGMPVDVPGDIPTARLLRRLLDAHDFLARHAWVPHVLVRGELASARALPFVDACLADLMAAGLQPPHAARAYRACWQLLVGELLSEHPVDRPRRPNPRTDSLTAADAQALPALALARTADPYLGPGANCAELRTALAALIDGLVAAGRG